MSDCIIVVDHAEKRFGEQVALRDVSVSFEAGKIHGIIGRNGSGKTVLFKCIVGLMPLTSGSIQVNGRHIETGKTVPDDIGAIIETPGFLPNYSGFRNLKFLATLRGRIKDAEIRKAIQQVGLDPESRKHVGKYSLGMRQRLGIAQAIMEHPKLLVLDEPMNGLDNNGVREMRELFIALKKEGTTISPSVRKGEKEKNEPAALSRTVQGRDDPHSDRRRHRVVRSRVRRGRSQGLL